MARKQNPVKRPKAAKPVSHSLFKAESAEAVTAADGAATTQVETVAVPEVKSFPLLELAQQVMQSEDKVVANISAPHIAKILSLGLQALGNRVDVMEEGRLAVPGMGVFVVKQIEVEKDGIKSKVKRIMFRRPAAKS